MARDAIHLVRGQRLGRHQRAKVGATDADIDDVGDLVALGAPPGTGMDGRAEFLHLGEHRLDLRHHILAIDLHRAAGAVTQGDMQHRTIFGEIDVLTGEHLFPPSLDIRLTRQIEQQGQGLLRHPVLGVVQQQIILAHRKLGETGRIAGEQLTQGLGRDFGMVALQRAPGRHFGQRSHLENPRSEQVGPGPYHEALVCASVERGVSHGENLPLPFRPKWSKSLSQTAIQVHNG